MKLGFYLLSFFYCLYLYVALAAPGARGGPGSAPEAARLRCFGAQDDRVPVDRGRGGAGRLAGARTAATRRPGGRAPAARAEAAGHRLEVARADALPPDWRRR